jgi:glyceraldehyde 3-phosphate dehydrogenase
MSVRVAINGFGRIGRNVLRAIVESKRTDIEVVGIKISARWKPMRICCASTRCTDASPAVTVKGDTISVGNGAIKVTAIKDPTQLPWKAGRRHRARMHRHLHLEGQGFDAPDRGRQARAGVGAGRWVDLTVVYGVNHDKLTSAHKVVSNASCMTNCSAPVAKVLNDAVGIEKGFMTTIHSYTGDQPTLDTMHKDLYRGRAAREHDPTSTVGREAVGSCCRSSPASSTVLPSACRRPMSRWSISNSWRSARPPGTINGAVKRAAEQQLKGILGFTDLPNVSMDFNHDPRSSVFHMDQTKVMDGNFVAVLSWYDNEWGLLQPHDRYRGGDGKIDRSLFPAQRRTQRLLAGGALQTGSQSTCPGGPGSACASNE